MLEVRIAGNGAGVTVRKDKYRFLSAFSKSADTRMTYNRNQAGWFLVNFHKEY